IFTFQLQDIVIANSEDKYIYEEIGFVYNQNFFVQDYIDKGTYIELYFTLENDIFLNNPYLSGYTNIKNNTFFYMYNFETLREYANVGVVYQSSITGSTLSGRVGLSKNSFRYYYE